MLLTSVAPLVLLLLLVPLVFCSVASYGYGLPIMLKDNAP